MIAAPHFAWISYSKKINKYQNKNFGRERILMRYCYYLCSLLKVINVKNDDT